MADVINLNTSELLTPNPQMQHLKQVFPTSSLQTVCGLLMYSVWYVTIAVYCVMLDNEKQLPDT
jgi:hypothetical protein